MRIIWISPLMPYPLNNGFKTRVYNLIKPLSKENDITLVSFIDPSEFQEENISFLSRYCNTVRYVPFPSRFVKAYSFFNTTPNGVLSRFSPLMKNVIEEEVRKTDFDVIIIEHLYMTQYMPANFKGLSIFSAHDVESLKYKSTSSIKRGLRQKYWNLIQYLKIQKYEKRMTRLFDLCITVSESDRNVLKRWSPSAKIEEIPIGIDTTEFMPIETILKNTKAMSFCGALNYAPNVDAIIYFCKEVFFHIKRNMPDVNLTIIGRKPPKEIMALGSDKNITVTGEVDDIKPFLFKSSVFVAPIRIGGGSKVKIIQAMGCGLPVVTTPEGSRGIHAVPGDDLFVANNSKEFAEQVLLLLRNKKLCRTVSENARRCIVEKYDINVIATKFSRMIKEEVVGKHS